jgi:hypothetical protein
MQTDRQTATPSGQWEYDEQEILKVLRGCFFLAFFSSSSSAADSLFHTVLLR